MNNRPINKKGNMLDSLGTPSQHPPFHSPKLASWGASRFGTRGSDLCAGIPQPFLAASCSVRPMPSCGCGREAGVVFWSGFQNLTTKIAPGRAWPTRFAVTRWGQRREDSAQRQEYAALRAFLDWVGPPSVGSRTWAALCQRSCGATSPSGSN